jgi:hypothetical protein
MCKVTADCTYKGILSPKERNISNRLMALKSMPEISRNVLKGRSGLYKQELKTSG